MKKTYGVTEDGQLNKGLTIVSQRPWVYRIDVRYERKSTMTQQIFVSLAKGWVFIYQEDEARLFWNSEVGIRMFWSTESVLRSTNKRRVKQITQE